MESITFQGTTAEAVIEQVEIPSPNTRLSADFFYSFSTNQAKPTMTNSSAVYLLVCIVFVLI